MFQTCLQMGILTVTELLIVTLFGLPCNVAAASDNDSPLTTDSCYCLHETVGTIKTSVSVIFYLDGGKERLLAVEQRGLVSRYSTGGLRIDTFMDIRDRVAISNSVGETRGLLSVVLDHDFDNTKKVYAYYTRHEDGKVYAYVSMFSAAGGTVDHASEVFLLRIYQPFEHGNGGPMLFGDDGYLYIFTGDGGEKDDLTGRAQNLNMFHGKVLRIDLRKQSFSEGESGIARMYAIPSSNPFVNRSDAKGEVYAYGIRNMWGCSLDSKTMFNGTGRIFCAETGTNKSDEINIIENGLNYGWNLVEGTHCLNASNCPSVEREGKPIYEFTHTKQHALVGGYMYRGKQFRQMAGADYYVYGDVITSDTYFLHNTGSNKWTNHKWDICELKKCPAIYRQRKLQHILAFGMDTKGELYLVMTDELIPESESGKILKLVHPSSNAATKALHFALMIGCFVIATAVKSMVD